MPDCFLGDDEIFCQVLCPSQCLCISVGVTCAHTGISKIPSFGVKYQSSIIFLNMEGNPLHLDVMSFVHFKYLEYLNISNSNIKYLCPRQISIFLFMKYLLILDVSKNKILTLTTVCVFGLPNLKVLYIQQNPLSSIDPKSFLNLYSVPLLKLNKLHLKQLGNLFFCSNSRNNLQILDISRNKLYSVSTKTFKCLHSLKVLLIYGNKFARLLSENVIKNLPLIIYHVQDSLECCKLSLGLCMFENELPVACDIKDLPTNALFAMQLPLMFIATFLNSVLFVLLLFTGLYQKKPLQFLITVKDLIAILSYALVSIFALIFHPLSGMVNLFCLSIGLISSLTLIFDLLVKVVESIILLKLLDAKSVQNEPKYSVIFRVVPLLSLFTLTGGFILFKFLFIGKHSSLSTKLKEILLHCVLFCFPKHHSILVHLSLILIILTAHITLNVKFAYSLRTHIFHMKGLGAKSLKYKKIITYISFVSVTTSCILIMLCLLLFTLLFTSSFFISYLLVIVLWLYLMNNLSMFLFSNKTFMENFKRCLLKNKI